MTFFAYCKRKQQPCPWVESDKNSTYLQYLDAKDWPSLIKGNPDIAGRGVNLALLSLVILPKRLHEGRSKVML